jgi:hypothetical protein
VNKCWAICRWIFILVVIGAVWLAVRNPAIVLAKKALDSYKQELIARGEKLNSEDWLPPPGQGSNQAALLIAVLDHFSWNSIISGVSQYQLVTTNRAQVVWRDTGQGWKAQNPSSDAWNVMDDTAGTNRIYDSNFVHGINAGFWDMPFGLAVRIAKEHSGHVSKSVSPYPGMVLLIRPAPTGGRDPSDIWDFMENMNRTNSVLYSNILSAVRAGPLDVPYDYSMERFTSPSSPTQWMWMPYPIMVDIRVVMPLTADVLLRLRQNRPAEASAQLKTLLELARKTCFEPNLTSLSVRAEIVDQLWQTTWQFLQSTNLTETQLHSLQTSWEQLDILRAVQPAFALRRANVGVEFDNLRRELSLSHRFLKEPGKILTGLIKDFSATKHSLGDDVRSARRSYADEFAAYREAEAELEAARSFCRNHAATALDRKLPSAAVMEAVAIAETQRQMAAAAIALERYHQENGRYPQGLSELLPAFLNDQPMDFMDGKPLRYRPDDNGLFVLYSVGLNGRDDGGNGWPEHFLNNSKFPAWKDGQDMIWPQPATDAEVAARLAALQESESRLGPAH